MLKNLKGNNWNHFHLNPGPQTRTFEIKTCHTCIQPFAKKQSINELKLFYLYTQSTYIMFMQHTQIQKLPT